MIITFTLPNTYQAIFPYTMRWLASKFLQIHYPDHNFTKWVSIKEHLITELDNEHAEYNKSLVERFFNVK